MGLVRKRLRSSPHTISRGYYTLIFFTFFCLHWRQLLTCCMDRVRLLHLHLQLHLNAVTVRCLLMQRCLDRRRSWKQYVFKFLTHTSIKGWSMFLAFFLLINYLRIWTVDMSVLLYWRGNNSTGGTRNTSSLWKDPSIHYHLVIACLLYTRIINSIIIIIIIAERVCFCSGGKKKSRLSEWSFPSTGNWQSAFVCFPSLRNISIQGELFLQCILSL